MKKLAFLLILFSVILISGCTQQPMGGVPDAWEGYLDLEGCNASCIDKGYDVGHCMLPENICEDDVESGECLPDSCREGSDKQWGCRCYCKYETPPEERECCNMQGSNEIMCFAEAKEIAEFSECTENGTLMDTHFCNEVTGTWWIDLDIEKEGCSPACVVYVETGEAEINWRCTGLLTE